MTEERCEKRTPLQGQSVAGSSGIPAHTSILPPVRTVSPPAESSPHDSASSPTGSPSSPPPSALPSPNQVPGSLDRAVEMIHFLRAHCPWDAKQTPQSLIPYLVEETHEVADAIRAGDPREVEGELGDLLLNLAFQIVIGEERGEFDRDSVTRGMEEKMRRRHPHLFGLGEQESWEAIKARERSGSPGDPDPTEGGATASILAGLASGMDPLMAAHRIQEKVSGVGFDWDSPMGAWEKVAEEVEEVREVLEGDPERLGEELGDLLFAVVNLSRLAGTHPSEALAKANRKFRRRFEALEELARSRGIVLHEAGLEALDRIWDEVKSREGSGD